jgi:hypothetical protein
VVQASLDIKRDPISKITNIKRVGGMAQVVECLPNKHKFLSSNSSSIKRKKERVSDAAKNASSNP